MKISKFSLEYLDEIGSWLTKRGMKAPLKSELPQIGYIALEDFNTPVACAFLRRVEGGQLAHLDGLATNPALSGEMRSEGIDAVVEAIMHTAREEGFKAVFAYSVDRNTLVRSAKHGFEVMPHALIVADLTKKA